MTSGRRTDRSESFGEALLGAVLDGAHELPPHLIGPLVADVVERLGGRRPQVLLQDYGQLLLVPLPGEGLTDGEPQVIDGSEAGRCFLDAAPVELPEEDGVRVHLPLLDGGDQVGVMAVTLDSVDDDDRRLLLRISGLVADLLVTKHGYSDLFFRVRRGEAMSVAAEIQWSLLPPLAMIMPRVAVAGILEPAYDVAGDSFDYALNGDVLHVVMIDAMGHGLDAATMATVAIGAYRHARRLGTGLSEIYDVMDRAVAEQFGPEHFLTAPVSGSGEHGPDRLELRQCPGRRVTHRDRPPGTHTFTASSPPVSRGPVGRSRRGPSGARSRRPVPAGPRPPPPGR
ncbi:PP2C family protein-serine/threonine phosphatase [Streptomyces griseofuscus]|uniref:PP2C family protein-serine/threonine phosphatase n=1 Tax=Streptomyces griseofuscus TaxID=146922 RepID=UPI0033ED9F11